MITQNIKYTTGKINQYILLLLCYFGILSCVNEDPLLTPENTDGDIPVTLTINAPSTTTPKMTLRSQTENEAKIQEIMVLVFQDNKFLYLEEGVITSSTVASTTLKVALRSTPNPLSLFLIANSNEVINNSNLLVNDSKTVVKEKLNKTFTESGISFPLPMSGEHDISSLSASGNNNISGIKMVRSIARADILVADNVNNFELVSVQLFRANSKIQVIPDIMTNASVTSPSIPDNAEANVTTQPLSVTNNKLEAQLYFPESEAPTESNRTSGATCIIIGGKYNGNSTTTYYRMDFNPGIQGHPFGSILRNHKYTFSIKGVGVPGADNPEDAANSPSAGITVEVESWDENTIDMWYEGDSYFSVSSRILLLRPWAGTFKQSDRITVNTNLPSFSIQWSDINGTPLGGSFPSATSISNANYIISIIDDTIKVKALTNNEQNPDRSDYFVIHAGKWDIVITINQYGLSKHMDDLIRVLSFSEIGDLGNGYADETSSAGALATRQILNKQFCPTGTFKFGGYHFTELSRIIGTTTLSSTVLSNHDVILLPYNQQPNLDAANIINNWLKAKQNRVLIIDADNSNTNINVLEAVGDDLGWSYTTPGTTYFDIPINETNELFTTFGLFGSISPGTQYRSYDGTWGMAKNENNEVIPLLQTPEGDMTIGVNMTKRIVYMGESQFLYSYTGGLSGNTGQVNNDQDKLIANLWAWVTEVVLSGK